MRRNFKKPLIKVASVGMSIAMATTPMVAIADDEGDITSDITNSDESTGDSENKDVTDGVK
ncbi:MAG: hypothetical protein K5883_08910, partial [Pseudobutyrivibrio sp.]|nr:hypothetical protein [Pseudobutyrivibrio sp.]